jgi:hypothetical protein
MLGLWPFADPLAVVRVRPSRKTKRLRDLSSKNCSWTENVFCVSKSWHDRRPECKYTNFAIAKFFPDADSRNSRAQASAIRQLQDIFWRVRARQARDQTIKMTTS